MPINIDINVKLGNVAVCSNLLFVLTILQTFWRSASSLLMSASISSMVLISSLSFQQKVVVDDLHGKRTFGDAAVDGINWTDDDAFFVVAALVFASGAFDERIDGGVGKLFTDFFDGDVVLVGCEAELLHVE